MNNAQQIVSRTTYKQHFYISENIGFKFKLHDISIKYKM